MSQSLGAAARLLLACCALLLASAGAPAHAKRAAFLIGVSTYDNLPPERQLPNSANDARSVAAALQGVGFREMIVRTDVKRSEFNDAWQRFLDSVEPDDEVVFVYSGHGVQVEGKNYLVPRDIPAVRTGEVARFTSEAIDFDKLRGELDARRPALILFILDACRDNPFGDRYSKAIGGKKGLAPVARSSGTFIMFAADENEEALERLSADDANPHSLFTRQLIPRIAETGLTLQKMARTVRWEVHRLAREVGHKQTPMYLDAIIELRDVCLAGCEAAAAPRQGASTDSEEELRGRMRPSVRIVAPSSGAAFAAPTMKIDYELRSPLNLPVRAVRALFDGRPWGEIVQGAAVPAVARNLATGSLTLNLPEQSVALSVVVETDAAASEPATVELKWAGAQRPVQVGLPRLKALVVGVSDYGPPELRLQFGAKDAQDFADAGAGSAAEERTDLGHGVFTYALLEGLSGRADRRGDDQVTTRELQSYVENRVRELTSGRQQPEFSSPIVKDDLVVARTK